MDRFSAHAHHGPIAPGASCCPRADGVAEDGPVGRFKLWELDPSAHCSIIGTCLSLDDLRRIIHKAALAIAPDTQDYDIHGYFVTQAGTRSSLSKLVHKALDRKYAPQIARFRRSCTAEELWELWRQSMAAGDVAGSYWALMTHRTPPHAMRIRAHNEVHMLSHLMGKSSRDDIKRLRQLEADCTDLSEKLARARTRMDAALRERDTRIRSLEAQLAVMPAAAPSGPSGEQRQKEAAHDKLRARFAILERRLKAERARARAAEAKLSEMQEEAPAHPPTQEEAIADLPAAETGTDLQGRSLLYVGGYPNVAPRLREHVERMQGRFLYHDGGIEVQIGTLPGLVSQADAVFCPVACVSHDACLRLKHLCRRHRKRFVLLRSAGLSSFVNALSEVANA